MRPSENGTWQHLISSKKLAQHNFLYLCVWVGKPNYLNCIMCIHVYDNVFMVSMLRFFVNTIINEAKFYTLDPKSRFCFTFAILHLTTWGQPRSIAVIIHSFRKVALHCLHGPLSVFHRACLKLLPFSLYEKLICSTTTINTAAI